MNISGKVVAVGVGKIILYTNEEVTLPVKVGAAQFMKYKENDGSMKIETFLVPSMTISGNFEPNTNSWYGKEKTVFVAKEIFIQ